MPSAAWSSPVADSTVVVVAATRAEAVAATRTGVVAATRAGVVAANRAGAVVATRAGVVGAAAGVSLVDHACSCFPFSAPSLGAFAAAAGHETCVRVPGWPPWRGGALEGGV